MKDFSVEKADLQMLSLEEDVEVSKSSPMFDYSLF